ncbi:unnamed protein product [Blepharisma stoltei]|uniref:Uncharacterized protein n=1 Tax=Blepharisma stoltei TaxID=1481888 RepID=A0AAU9IX67_9CILI|nr:unnamed protein product [Blepharisma stoltei]
MKEASLNKLRQEILEMQKENENLRKIAYINAMEELEQAKTENKRLRYELQLLSSPSKKKVTIKPIVYLDPIEENEGRVYAVSSLASPIAKSKSTKFIPGLERSSSGYKLELPPINPNAASKKAYYSSQPALSPAMREMLIQESRQPIKPKPVIKYNSTSNEEVEVARLAKKRRETFQNLAAKKYHLTDRNYTKLEGHQRLIEEDNFVRNGILNGDFGNFRDENIYVVDKDSSVETVKPSIVIKQRELQENDETHKADEKKKTIKRIPIEEIDMTKAGTDVREYEERMRNDEKKLQEAKELIKAIETRQKQQLQVMEEEKKRKQEADKTPKATELGERRKKTHKIVCS